MKINVILLSICCLFSLNACGGTGEPTSSAPESPNLYSSSDSNTKISSVSLTGDVSAPPAITGVQLLRYVAKNQFEPLQALEDNAYLVLADLPEIINFEAVSEDASQTGSVKFLLEGPRRINRTENTAIFTMADSYSNLRLAKNDLPAGSYVLWVTPYSGTNGNGQAGATLRRSFTVSETRPASTVPAITSVQLLEYVSADTYAPVRTLVDGDVLFLDELPNLMNIEAVSADMAKTGSVSFVLDGPKSLSRTENQGIFTMADAYYNLDIASGGLPAGDYTLTITPYAGADATGAVGDTTSLSFTVSAAPDVNSPSISAVYLLAYESNNAFSQVRQLQDGDTLSATELPSLFNIEAVSNDVVPTGSVDFELDGPAPLQRYENQAIYTMADANHNLDLAALPAGDYTLSITPYSGSDLSGIRGRTLTLQFTVSDAPVVEAPVEEPGEEPVEEPDEVPSDLPTVGTVQLLEYVSSNQFNPIRTVADGDTLVLAELPNLVNFEAVPTHPEMTASVSFSLQGPKTLERTENQAIYTLADAYYNFDLSAQALPEGSYTLSITPFTGRDGTGEKGATSVTTFEVIAAKDDGTDRPDPEPIPEPEPHPPLSNVPAITELHLIAFTAPGTKEILDLLTYGETIDRAAIPSVFNIEAVSADPANTGSVAFALEGPLTVNRVENNAIYTLVEDTSNINLLEGGLPTGSYTLTVTPYSGANATGDAGYPLAIRFYVSGEPTPVFTPPVANDDAYQLDANTTLSVDAAKGLIANDTAEDLNSAEVLLTLQPAHGSLNLNKDGSFTYKPDYEFGGIDSFEYALVDRNGKEDAGLVTLNIAKATAPGTGFTPIVASDDTRTVYVSSSEGLDSNNGYSIGAPVRTLKKAFSLVRDGYPDHVLLKRGDVWVDENLSGIKSGRSASEPAVVAFYGESGPRPRLKVSGQTMNPPRLYHVNIMGLELEAYKMNPSDRAFDGDTSANIRLVGDFEDILFEDMKLRFIEFIIQGWNGGTPRDIHIRRSMILDKYSAGTSYNRNSRPSGIYTDSGEGLTIEESLWDHNGWNEEVVGAGANMYNHNMYISEKNNVGNKIVIRDNIVTRGSALGIHGRPGGLYENNFFARNAIGLQMGYKDGPALSAGTIAHARNNVITEGLNMDRGIDSCSGSNLCTKAIWGLQVENLGNADVRVEGNIVSNRLFEHNGYVSGIRQNADAKYSDNIIYRWDSASQGTDKNYPDPGRTLADYNAYLGGERSFEAFIQAARSRGLQEWDARYSADAINDYVRAGFGR